MKTSSFFGATLILISLFLAFNFKYNHFYEFTLVGLFIFFSSLLKDKLFGVKEFIFTYILYFFFGLFIDISSQYFGLWHYSYHNFLEYIPLYLLIYPLGGIVMLQSYFFVKERTNFKLNTKNVPRKKVFVLDLILLVIVMFVISLLNMESFMKLGFILLGFLVISSFILFDFLSDRLNNISFSRQVVENPISIVIVTLIATYANAFLHEYPNTFANEWIYTVKTNSFLDLNILNIPLIVLFGWMTLSIGPVIMYYFIHSYFKKHH